MKVKKEVVMLLISSALLFAGVTGCSSSPDEEAPKAWDEQGKQDSEATGSSTEQTKQDGEATGSSMEQTKQDSETSESSTEQTEQDSDAAGSITDGSGEDYSATDVDNLFATADVDGYIAEISDSEISVIPTEKIDENTAGVTLVGAGTVEDTVHVAVSGDTIYQIMRIDLESLALISLDDADKNGMERDGSVLVYGSKQDEKHWSADKIILVKWE